MRTKLRRPQPFLALLQMCQLLKEGPQHPGASRPQGGTAGSSWAAWAMSRTNPISYTEGKRSHSFHIQPWSLLPYAGGGPALQSAHLGAFYASTQAQTSAVTDSSATAAAGSSCSPRRALSLLERCKQEGFSYSAY